MASRTKYIGTVTTSTIILLLAWFVSSANFDVEIDLTDKVCAGSFDDPCEVSFNITAKAHTYYLYNQNGVDLNFLPDVKDSYTCKRDGRYRALWREDRSLAPCGVGFREFDFKTPLTPKYKYVEKFVQGKKHEYKLVVFKNNPDDEIKWGGTITGEKFDPKFLPQRLTVIESCTTIQYEEIEFTDGLCDSEYIFINNKTGINEIIPSKKPCRTSKTTIKSEEICRTQGFIIKDKTRNCEEFGWTCYNNGTHIIEKAPYQSDTKSAKCLEGSGERCNTKNIITEELKRMGVDSPIKEIKDIIER